MNDRDDTSSERLPEGLEKDLRGLFAPPGAGGGMPAARDAQILAAARRAGQSRRHPWRWIVGTGLAAAVALAATLWHFAPTAPPATPAYARTGDIRDAYFLARQLKSGAAPALQTWDANHDGRLDQSDVDALAFAAVHVDKGATQ